MKLIKNHLHGHHREVGILVISFKKSWILLAIGQGCASSLRFCKVYKSFSDIPTILSGDMRPNLEIFQQDTR